MNNLDFLNAIEHGYQDGVDFITQDAYGYNEDDIRLSADDIARYIVINEDDTYQAVYEKAFYATINNL